MANAVSLPLASAGHLRQPLPRGSGQALTVLQSRTVKGIAAILAFTAPWWLFHLFFPGEQFDWFRGLLFSPIVLAIDWLLIAQVVRRDPVLRAIMPVALIMKLAATGQYIYMVQHMINGGDVLAYHVRGQSVATQFGTLGELPSLGTYFGTAVWGTVFIENLTGIIYLVLGPSLTFAMILFSSVAYWGQFLTYRAFCEAFPRGNRATAAMLLFILPSNVFWTATVGKDALIFFAIALVAYGFALLVRAPGARPWMYILAGMLVVFCIRPHVASILGAALTFGFTLGRPLRGASGMFTKLLFLPILVVSSYFILTRAEEVFHTEDVRSGVKVLNRVSKNNHFGSGAISGGETLAGRLAMSPVLLYRPFPWEVRNLQGALATIEGVGVLVLPWMRRRTLYAVLRNWRTTPYIPFILFFVVVFSLAAAGAFSNLGLIARQRVMVLPYALMLFCIASPEVARLPMPRFLQRRVAVAR